jgi:phosphatidylinositol alpha-1,6-mannosyltransferase
VAPKSVLFVSKPIAPPYHDGTKCLVRDVALNLERVQPSVMSCAGAAPLGNVRMEAVYADGGSFAPALLDNVRAASWLLARSRADLWHFVFAPNVRTSKVGRAMKSLRRKPVVQTVASPPRSFDQAPDLLFGDVVVTQSRWTRAQFRRRFSQLETEAPRMQVIYPPVPRLRRRSAEELAAVRAQLEIAEDRVVFVYPGDLETSRGADTVAEAVKALVQLVPQAMVVFAYRPKTSRAEDRARTLRARVPAEHTRFISTLSDVLALIQGARAVLFPVEDLWGKVDLPIVLLEAMELAVPVIALDRGPLAELGGVKRIQQQSGDALARAAYQVHVNAGEAAHIAREQHAFVEKHCRAPVTARAYEDLYLDLLS